MEVPSRKGHHPSHCTTCSLRSTSHCQVSQLSPSSTSLHHSQLELLQLSGRGTARARQLGAEITQTLQHFKSFRATQKSCINCMFQLVLKPQLHLTSRHVLSVLVWKASPLGTLRMAQSSPPWGQQSMPGHGSSHLPLLHLRTCTALEVTLKL